MGLEPWKYCLDHSGTRAAFTGTLLGLHTLDPSQRHVPSDWAHEIRLQAVKTALLVQVHDEYSSNSFRLMAMAVGVIPNVTQLDLVHMTQQQVETHVTHMELLCLMVLTNNIRPDSKETISELQEGYVVMLSKHIPAAMYCTLPCHTCCMAPVTTHCLHAQLSC